MVTEKVRLGVSCNIIPYFLRKLRFFLFRMSLSFRINLYHSRANSVDDKLIVFIVFPENRI